MVISAVLLSTGAQATARLAQAGVRHRLIALARGAFLTPRGRPCSLRVSPPRGFGRPSRPPWRLCWPTLMFVLVFMILALAAYVPVSPQPEKAFVRRVCRFFRSCEYLVSTLGCSDPARSPTRLARWRRSYHAAQIATLPQTLSLWGESIDPKLLAGTTPEQLQALATDIQALGYRMQETLEARAAVRSVSTGPEVQNEIDRPRCARRRRWRSSAARARATWQRPHHRRRR